MHFFSVVARCIKVPPLTVLFLLSQVFGGLMIISTSLALGLIVGFALTTILEDIFAFFWCLPADKLKTNDAKLLRAKDRRIGMYSSPTTTEQNPSSVAKELQQAILSGLKTDMEADQIFNAIDIDQSDSVDEGEVTYYMLKAGLTKDQIQRLFAGMDKDGNGEVSREEFRKAILNRDNKSLLEIKQEGGVEEEPVIVEPKSDSQDIENRSSASPTATTIHVGEMETNALQTGVETEATK